MLSIHCHFALNLNGTSALKAQIHYSFDRFITTHFLIPFMVFVLIFSGLEFTRLDYQISRLFFDPVNQVWPLRYHWLTQTVLHDWAQKFSIGVGILLFIALFLSWLKTSLRPYLKLLAFLFAASIAGPVLIAVLKNSTHIYCPWDLKLFGGDKPYIRLFDFARYPLAVGHCFPGGHAGGGYAFISLYFFLLLTKPEYRYYGLAAGLSMGLIYGVTQQMRGAHFLSHDIFSLATCWFSSLFLFCVFFWKKVQ